MIENIVEKKQAVKAGFTAETIQLTVNKLFKQKPGTDVAMDETKVETSISKWSSLRVPLGIELPEKFFQKMPLVILDI